MRYWLIVAWFLIRDYFDVILLTALLLIVCLLGVVMFEKVI